MSNKEPRTHTMAVSVLICGIIGWAIGIGQVIIMGSWDLFYWAYMPMLPFYSAIGWALYGMILGGSGVFAKAEEQREEPARESVRSIAHAA